MKQWIPTAVQVELIKRAAAREVGRRAGSLVLEPGRRYNVEDSARPSGINIALVSDREDWEDTDLEDCTDWAEFRRGVTLTADDRAVVDFYIRRRGDEYNELLGNVTVYYAGGRVVRVRGYPGEYPTE